MENNLIIIKIESALSDMFLASWQGNEIKNKSLIVVDFAIHKLESIREGKISKYAKKTISKEINELIKIKKRLSNTDPEKLDKLELCVRVLLGKVKNCSYFRQSLPEGDRLHPMLKIVTSDLEKFSENMKITNKKIKEVFDQTQGWVKKYGSLKSRISRTFIKLNLSSKKNKEQVSFSWAQKAKYHLESIHEMNKKALIQNQKKIAFANQFVSKALEELQTRLNKLHPPKDNKKIEQIKNRRKNLTLIQLELKERGNPINLSEQENFYENDNILLKEVQKEIKEVRKLLGSSAIRRLTAIAKKSSSKGSSYIFTQQFNNSCHLSPIKNLQRLKQLKEHGYDLSKMDTYSRRQWLGENQEMLISWNQAITQITENQNEYPKLHEFLTSGISEGPVMPNFYNAKGKPYFSGIKGLIEFKEMPIFLIDVTNLQSATVSILGKEINLGSEFSPDDLGLKTAIVKDKGKYKIYNGEAKQFEEINEENLPWITIETNNENPEKPFTLIKINPELDSEIRKKYRLAEGINTVKMYKNEGLGFEEIGQIDELVKGLEYNGHRYVPYLTSLLKLMLLSSGIGTDNKKIDEEHPEYPLYVEVKKAMNKVQNLWTDLSSEDILQFHMAEILDEDPYLKAAMEQTCDLYVGVFKNYRNLVDEKVYRDKEGNKVQNAGKYLPGESQMLSYAFNLRLRWLWYGMQNPSVLCKAQGINLPLFLAKKVNNGLRRLAYKKHKLDLSKVQSKHDSEVKGKKYISYMDVWQIMRQKLMERMQSRKVNNEVKTDFVSFDDHGWVMSFDPKINEMQYEKLTNNEDRALAKDFGFAGIESWWGSEMPTFYKQN